VDVLKKDEQDFEWREFDRISSKIGFQAAFISIAVIIPSIWKTLSLIKRECML
jgi:hypothetical protein